MNEEILEHIFELKREKKEGKQSSDTTIPKKASPKQSSKGFLAKITTPFSSKNKDKKSPKVLLYLNLRTKAIKYIPMNVLLPLLFLQI